MLFLVAKQARSEASWLGTAASLDIKKKWVPKGYDMLAGSCTPLHYNYTCFCNFFFFLFTCMVAQRKEWRWMKEGLVFSFHRLRYGKISPRQQVMLNSDLQIWEWKTSESQVVFVATALTFALESICYLSHIWNGFNWNSLLLLDHTFLGSNDALQVGLGGVLLG